MVENGDYKASLGTYSRVSGAGRLSREPILDRSSAPAYLLRSVPHQLIPNIMLTTYEYSDAFPINQKTTIFLN